MFKNILLPTDGSEVSEVAIRKGVEFAASIGARLTGFYVIPEFHVLSYRTGTMADTKSGFARDSKEHAERYLGRIRETAQAAGVACETTYATGDQPYAAIIKAAQDHGCDLILMASHGRRGVQAFLLGSETQKVLTHTKIPVLVLR
jgi:nucleotide-binding universal stress UspA family protein